MGTIKSEIMNLFLAEHPEQESILKPFLNGFDINYAEVKSINICNYRVYKTSVQLRLSWS